MRYNLRAAALAAVAAVSLAGLLGPPLAAHADTVAHAGPAAHAVTADFPDGDPDVVTIEPDITSRPMCESSFPNYCARDTGNSGSSGSIIFEGSNTPGPAENTHFSPNGNIFTWNGHNYRTGTLELTGHPGLCYGSPGSDAETASCSTGAGTIWGHGASNGHDVWISRLWTQQANGLMVLAGIGSGGERLEVLSWFNPDWLKRWNF